MQAIQRLGRVATAAAVAAALTACVAYPQGTYQNGYPAGYGSVQSGSGFPGAAQAGYPSTSYPSTSYPTTSYPVGNYPSQSGQYNYVQQGRVLNIETVRVQDGSGIGAGGAIAGGVIGGVLGNQVGKGNGRTLATIAGVVGGALAGNAVQNSVGGGSVRDIYRVTVQLQDGSVRSFDYQNAPQFNIGETVRVDGNQIYR
ncbi:glycine zipper 2TM domain-containing protein [Comamonas guangdongensis]|uniref:Glycine zipper 2TM domain-containing protein n=1 Tax=Comamonas guangdongensis TaxID=510515 RepID=A0ABV3ZPW3_9BURK